MHQHMHAHGHTTSATHNLCSPQTAHHRHTYSIMLSSSTSSDGAVRVEPEAGDSPSTADLRAPGLLPEPNVGTPDPSAELAEQAAAALLPVPDAVQDIIDNGLPDEDEDNGKNEARVKEAFTK